jgi:hypothetical protein
MFMFMNCALNELAHYQLRQSKLLIPYQPHNALVIYSLKCFVMKESVSNVDKLTQTVLLAIDPVNVSFLWQYLLLSDSKILNWEATSEAYCVENTWLCRSVTEVSKMRFWNLVLVR